MILALDASTDHGSVALLSGGQVLQELSIETPRGRGGALFAALEEILRDALHIRRVVVGIGPGSYNGVRSAIAASWGIATARKIPLVGICSLLGLDENTYCAVGDARRGQYFFACISRGNFLAQPQLVTKDQLEAAVQMRPHLPVYASAPLEFLRGVIVRSPSAAKLALLAADWAPNNPQPLYLKPPHITASRGTKGPS